MKCWIPLLALAGLLHLPIALAHGPHHHHSRSCDDCNGSARTISGTIQQIGEDAGGTLEATLNTAAVVWRVRLGNAELLRDEDLRLEPGDRITVSGSSVHSRGRRVLLAGEVRRGDQRWTLRTSRGCGPCGH